MVVRDIYFLVWVLAVINLKHEIVDTKPVKS